MEMKGQGALEYLLLIGGAVLIAAIVITLVSGIGSSGTGAGKSAALDALCLKFDYASCGVSGDPDGGGACTATANCARSPTGATAATFIKCIGVPTTTPNCYGT